MGAARDQLPLCDILQSQLASSLDEIDRITMPHPETQLSLALPGDDSATAATEGQAADAPVTAAAVPPAPAPVLHMAPAGADDELLGIFFDTTGGVLEPLRDNPPTRPRTRLAPDRLT